MYIYDKLKIKGNFNDLKLIVGDDTDYIQIIDNLLLIGNFTCWDDLEGPSTHAKKGNNEKPEFNYSDLTLDFESNSSVDCIYYNIQLPHRWKKESTIYPHIHYIQDQNVVPDFKVEYRWVEIGEIVPAWDILNLNYHISPYTGGRMHQVLTNNTGISGIGKTLSSIFQCKLYRDPDSYVGICGVMSFDIHIEIDSFGSKEEYKK